MWAVNASVICIQEVMQNCGVCLCVSLESAWTEDSAICTELNWNAYYMSYSLKAADSIIQKVEVENIYSICNFAVSDMHEFRISYYYIKLISI